MEQLRTLSSQSFEDICNARVADLEAASGVLRQRHYQLHHHMGWHGRPGEALFLPCIMQPPPLAKRWQCLARAMSRRAMKSGDQRRVRTTYSFRSRVQAMYSKGGHPRNFRTKQEAMDSVRNYLKSIKTQLMRLCGGLMPREALAKYQRLAQEHHQYFDDLKTNSTSFHSERDVED
eukprot:2459723-Prorocentrum_lima.AAC.1